MSADARLGLPPPEDDAGGDRTGHGVVRGTPYTRGAKTLLQSLLNLFTEAGSLHFLPPPAPPPPDPPDDDHRTRP